MTDLSKWMRDFSPLTIRGGFILTMITLNIVVSCGLAKAQVTEPCMQITTACIQADFKAGSAKEGFGLMVDCINPIMRGAPQRAKATKPLPQIDAELIAACKARNPDFGQPKRAPSRSPGPNEPPGPDPAAKAP